VIVAIPEQKMKTKALTLIRIAMAMTALALPRTEAAIYTGSALPGNIVQNGGFEQGGVGWGWTYNFGLWYGFPDAAEGGNYGEVDGTIYQDLATTAGQQYHLQFALAGNFNISSPTTVNVLWGGATVGAVSWSPAGHTVNNLGWVWTDLNLAANSSTTRLTFANPFVGDGSGRIDLVDAISVVAIPELSNLVFLALLSFVALKRRQ
jgi:Protein of unknown function (DUF642)